MRDKHYIHYVHIISLGLLHKDKAHHFKHISSGSVEIPSSNTLLL